MTWTTSTTRTAPIFAPIRPARESGEPPSRLRTPYERSKAVAIDRLTRLVEITARARMPGSRKSIGRAVFGVRAGTSEKKTSRTSGRTTITNRFSPRRAVRRSSIPSWASADWIGGAPFAGR